MRRGAIALTLLVLVCAGCGGGGEETTATPVTRAEPAPQRSTATADPADLRRVESVCDAMVAEARRLGAAVGRKKEFASDPLTVTTNLIAPAIPVVERSAKRLRDLEAERLGPQIEAYVRIYDPILALLRQRVAAGKAGDRERAQELEAQIVELAALQKQLAAEAGLNGCDVDFVGVFATLGH